MYRPYNGIANNEFNVPIEEVNGVEMPNSNRFVAGQIYSPTSRQPWQRPRLQWTPALHEIFVNSVSLLGGPDEAKPTAIVQTMESLGAFGLTIQQVKSHLQKYRNLHRQQRRETREQAQAQGMVLSGANNIASPPQPQRAANPVVQDNRATRVENPVVNNTGSNMDVQELPKDDDKWYDNCLADNGCDLTVWEYINNRN